MNSWLKGLLSAFISGVATGTATVFIVPVSVTTANLATLGYMALVGAIIGVLNYLQKSPFPEV